MASGREHTLATMAVGAAGVVHFAEVGNMVAAVMWGAGALYGLVAQPDLDIIEEDSGYIGLGIMRETHPLLERLWKAYWLPYGKILGHRSIFSHAPLIGTFLRIAYAFPYIVFTGYLPHIASAEWFIAAACATDAAHWIMDWRVWQSLGFFRQPQRGGGYEIARR